MTGGKNPIGGDGWEVVSRHRKERGPPEVVSAPVAPISTPQKKSKAKAKDVTHKEAAPKENDKKPAAEKAKKIPENKQSDQKKSESVKPKPLKSLEQCFAMMSMTELQDACETMGLMDMARYLNYKLLVNVNDELFIQSSGYPLSIVPIKIKDLIISTIKTKAHLFSMQNCIEFCLLSIANDMVKDLPVNGFKLMVQCIAEVDPTNFAKCTSKLNLLMNSYQNRPPIGLSLFWAIGQGGLKDFNVGVQVWKDSMLPMIEKKHYYKYVVDYLILLLQIHSLENNAKKISMKPDVFMDLFTFIHTNRKIFPKAVEKSLLNASPRLRKLCFEKSQSQEKFKFFEKLFKELPDTYCKENQMYDLRTEEVLKSFIDALCNGNSVHSEWKILHTKYLKQSSHVLNYIQRMWNSLSKDLNSDLFFDTVSSLKVTYQKTAKLDGGNLDIEVILKGCTNIEKKSSGSKGFPWFTGCFVLLIAICGAAVTYDIQTASSYDKSHTAYVTKNALDYGCYGLHRSLAASARGFLWAEKNAPYYCTTVSEFSKPYVELASDMGLVVSNQAKEVFGNVKDYAVAKWPVVYSTVDHYAPGVLDTMHSYISSAWDGVKTFCCFYTNIVVTYFKTKVFVDNWAPNVLHAKTLDALNTTQLYAREYYSRFHKNVDHYSKL